MTNHNKSKEMLSKSDNRRWQMPNVTKISSRKPSVTA